MVRQYVLQTQWGRNRLKLEAGELGVPPGVRYPFGRHFDFDSVITLAARTIRAIAAQKICIFLGPTLLCPHPIRGHQPGVCVDPRGSSGSNCSEEKIFGHLRPANWGSSNGFAA